MKILQELNDIKTFIFPNRLRFARHFPFDDVSVVRICMLSQIKCFFEIKRNKRKSHREMKRAKIYIKIIIIINTELLSLYGEWNK